MSSSFLCSQQAEAARHQNVTYCCQDHAPSLQRHFIKIRFIIVDKQIDRLEGARETTYLSHVNFYRRPLFQKNKVSCPDCPWKHARQTCMKSVALTVFELLAFNAQKFRDHVTLATPPFRKKI